MSLLMDIIKGLFNQLIHGKIVYSDTTFIGPDGQMHMTSTVTQGGKVIQYSGDDGQGMLFFEGYTMPSLVETLGGYVTQGWSNNVTDPKGIKYGFRQFPEISIEHSGGPQYDLVWESDIPLFFNRGELDDVQAPRDVIPLASYENRIVLGTFTQYGGFFEHDDKTPEVTFGLGSNYYALDEQVNGDSLRILGGNGDQRYAAKVFGQVDAFLNHLEDK